MYCSTCGFESTQKTNYCKRCGATLNSAATTTIVCMPGSQIAIGFVVIAAFAYFGLRLVYNIYLNMMFRGMRGDDVTIPFMIGVVLVGAVALFLTWQMSRLITLTRKQVDQAANQERPKFVEVQYAQPPAHLATPTDSIGNVAEHPSVIEHTTRQMAGGYRESNLNQ